VILELPAQRAFADHMALLVLLVLGDAQDLPVQPDHQDQVLQGHMHVPDHQDIRDLEDVQVFMVSRVQQVILSSGHISAKKTKTA